HTIDDLKHEMADAKIAVDTIERREVRIAAHFANGEDRDKFTDLVKDRFPNLTVESSNTEGGGANLQLALAKREEQRIRESAMEQSWEPIRTRSDQSGVTEPIIQREGTQDILIQLPGIQDPQRAKELIGRTAILEFKLVSTLSDQDDYISGKKPLPAGVEILN